MGIVSTQLWLLMPCQGCFLALVLLFPLLVSPPARPHGPLSPARPVSPVQAMFLGGLSVEMSLTSRVPCWKVQWEALLGESETSLSSCLRWIPVSASRGQGRYVL